MSTIDLASERRGSFRAVRALAAAYVALCAGTLLAAVLLRHHPDLVTDAVWVRGTLVTASALLTYGFAVGAARGSRRAYLRLRIVTAVMVVAIAVIISIPGLFPLWMRLEQGVCGLLLVALVAIVNGRRMRSLFAARG